MDHPPLAGHHFRDPRKQASNLSSACLPIAPLFQTYEQDPVSARHNPNNV